MKGGAAAALTLLPVLLCPARAQMQARPGTPAPTASVRLIRLPAGTARPHASPPAGSTKLTVSLNVKKLVTDAVYYTSDCESAGIGIYKAPDLPLYGTLDLNFVTNIQDLNNDACKGQTFKGVAVYYTWKINAPGVTEDYFQLSLTDPDGHVTTSDWLAELYVPQNQPGQLYFTNPYAGEIAAGAAPSQVTSDAAQNAPSATGISADGISPAVAVYKTSNSAPVQFSQAYQDTQFNSNPVILTSYLPDFLIQNKGPAVSATNTVTVTPACDGQICVALALVWPPAQMPIAASNLESGDFPAVTANITATQGAVAVTSSLVVYPPPLLLVHGIWSSARQAGFSPYSNPSGFYQWITAAYPHSLVFPVDYGEVSYQSFDSDAIQTALRVQLASALEQAGQQGIVARAVDVVAHGMGALVARWFLAQPPSATAPYLVPDPVHRLITIGSPHMGSNLASTLWNEQDSLMSVPAQLAAGSPGDSSTLAQQLCLLSPGIGASACSLKNLLKLFGKQVDTGIQSLEGPDLSPQLTALTDKAVPTASVTFNAILGESPSTTQQGLHVPGVTELFLDNLTSLFAASGGITSIFNGEVNDTFVPLSSQEDRTANTDPLAMDIAVLKGIVNTSWLPQTLAPASGETAETASQDVWSQALYWLKGGYGALDSTGAPPASAPLPVFDLTGYTLVPASNITFLPASNSTLATNTTVSIAAASASKTITQILLFQVSADPADVPLYYATQAPYSVSFTPARMGSASFVAFALFSDMTYTAATLNYTLQPSGRATALQAVDAPSVSLGIGTSVRVHASATFPGGPVDVTQAATYKAHSGNSAVFTTSAGGVITAAGPGTDTLDISYAGLRASTPITTFCTYTLGPSTQVVPNTGGDVQIQVATQANCPWTAALDSSWIAFTNQSGAGSGAITLSAPANPTAYLRTVNVTAGGQSAAISQPAVACSYTVSPLEISVGYASASGSLNVSTSIFCPVVASSDSPWVSVNAGTSSVSYAVAPNAVPEARTATLTVGTQTVTLTQAAAPTPGVPPVLPVIQAGGGVVNAASFLGGLASGSWVSILGSNLSSTTRLWQSSDFQGSRLPTSLDGVQVKINGRPAYVYYISPTQLNVLAPVDPTVGPVTVQVVNSLGSSSPLTVNKTAVDPALFAYLQQSGRYAIAQQGGTYALIGPEGLLGSGVALQQAKPGDSIIFYANGLGATDPPYPDGQIIQSPARLAASLTVEIGGLPATVPFAGIVGSGLYQVNVVVPDLPPGDASVVLKIGGVQSGAQVFIPIQAR